MGVSVSQLLFRAVL